MDIISQPIVNGMVEGLIGIYLIIVAALLSRINGLISSIYGYPFAPAIGAFTTHNYNFNGNDNQALVTSATGLDNGLIDRIYYPRIGGLKTIIIFGYLAALSATTTTVTARTEIGFEYGFEYKPTNVVFRTTNNNDNVHYVQVITLKYYHNIIGSCPVLSIFLICLVFLLIVHPQQIWIHFSHQYLEYHSLIMIFMKNIDNQIQQQMEYTKVFQLNNVDFY